MRKYIVGLLLLCLLSVGTGLFAAEIMDVTDVGVSAHMIGLGYIGGFKAYSGSLFENPAALAGIQRDKISFSDFFVNTVADQVNFNSVSIATEIMDMPMAIGYMEAKVDDIYFTGENSSSQFYIRDTFAYKDSQIKIGGARKISDEVSVGMALTYYNFALLDTFGQAFNLDAGLLYTLKDHDVVFSVTAKNIIPLKMTYTNGAERTIPLKLIGAVEKKLGDVTLYGQIQSKPVVESLKSIGVKYQPSWLNIIYLSAGWSEYEILHDPGTRINLGMGLELETIQLYVAYESVDYVIQTNQFYTSLNFVF